MVIYVIYIESAWQLVELPMLFSFPKSCFFATREKKKKKHNVLLEILLISDCSKILYDVQLQLRHV